MLPIPVQAIPTTIRIRNKGKQTLHAGDFGLWPAETNVSLPPRHTFVSPHEIRYLLPRDKRLSLPVRNVCL